MIAKKHKLPIDEFPKKSESVFRGQLFTIKGANNSVGRTRIGVLVSKKINSKASGRNFIRRTLYRGFRDKLSSLPTDMDLLVVVGAPIMEVDLDTKKKLLEELDKGTKTLIDTK